MKIKIGDNFYNFFDEISVTFSLDRMASVFSVKTKFDPNNRDHVYIFLPLSYRRVKLFTDDNELLFTGVTVNTSFPSTEKDELSSISGYSLAGVLEDSTIPYEAYPLERSGVSLAEVTRSVLQPFDQFFSVDPAAQREANLVYEKTVAEPTETVKNYLSKLASQRGLSLGHTADGYLRYFKPNVNGAAKSIFNTGNTLSMSLAVNGQGIHSEVSVIRQASKDDNNLTPVDTVKNPMSYWFKSAVKVLSSGTETDTNKAARTIVGAELNNIKLKIEVDGIVNLKIGDLVYVENPEIYLFNKTKFIIRDMTWNVSKKGEKSTLDLVLPETYTGVITKNVFAV